MKLLFINIAFEGHHLDYLKALSNMEEIESHVILERSVPDLKCEQHVIPDLQFGSNKIVNHLKWCSKVKKIAKLVQPDVIHLVWGDSFYRFFGVGFFWLKKYQSVVTFHQVRKSRLHQLSIRILSSIFSAVVVHTHSLFEELKKYRIQNINEITYPNLRILESMPKETAKAYLGIKTDKPVLLSLGGTRWDKGLDILMKALTKIDEPFHLLIAGAEQNITAEDIHMGIADYFKDTTVILKYLSEKEMEACYSACDYVVLPYRKIFDGASGPLAEGVAYGKGIIGPSHGSIGEIIKDNHIGKTFATEDIDSLSETIEEMLQSDFLYDNRAKTYQKNLKVSVFQDKYRDLYNSVVHNGGGKK